ncbi:MAG: serine/threonine-protein kinase, partial [Thermoanaerobaculia bacterium]
MTATADRVSAGRGSTDDETTDGAVADGTTSQRQRVLKILDQALDVSPAERPPFLDGACGGDDRIRGLVEEMLELEGDADRFLSRPALPRATESPQTGLEAGLRVGHYRIVELLGRGGMGSVYRAVREDDFEIEVAIKLVQAGLSTAATVRRFESERQILARLEHPNIARLLDGGTTADGRPYLVMEYVDGVTIDAYCDTHRLSTRQRLELFQQVCSALAFAHQSLVVHRDLKPGNILITAEGVPKLLDFGIAKLLDPSDAEVTLAEDRLMTPRYASPEQVLGDLITTASDIYTLGLLLYKLLIGRLPSRLESCTFGEVPSRICRDEPLRPSTAVARAEEIQTPEGRVRKTPEEIGRARDGDLSQLRRRLSGDVDAIVLKALRKEPQHRYASVERLSEDIRRHLEGLPVLARKGTLLYRGSRFVRRHRWGLAAALAVVLLTAGFLLRERQRLVDERHRSQRLATVLWNLITVADPDEGELTTRRMLDRARAQSGYLDEDPELQVEILDALGNMHRKLGNLAEARELTAEALDFGRRLYQQENTALARLINNLGTQQLALGEYEKAEGLFREALDMCLRLGEGESPDGLVSLNNLATVLLYSGRYAEAETLYHRGLEIRERKL